MQWQYDNARHHFNSGDYYVFAEKFIRQIIYVWDDDKSIFRYTAVGEHGSSVTLLFDRISELLDAEEKEGTVHKVKIVDFKNGTLFFERL